MIIQIIKSLIQNEQMNRQKNSRNAGGSEMHIFINTRIILFLFLMLFSVIIGADEEKIKEGKEKPSILNTDENGNTRLHLSVIHKNMALFEYLLKRKEIAIIKNKQSLTALDLLYADEKLNHEFLAKIENPVVLYRIGKFYMDTGDAAKEEIGLQYLRKAGGKNNLGINNALGILFMKKKLFEDAIICYRRAAEKEDFFAQHELGQIYGNKALPVFDPIKAILFYKLAANKYNMAAYQLGNIYFYGHGAKRDYEEAFKWYQLSTLTRPGEIPAEGGFIKVAECYMNGLGVKRNPVMAYVYYYVANSVGFSGGTLIDYRQKIAELECLLNEGQKSEAKREIEVLLKNIDLKK